MSSKNKKSKKTDGAEEHIPAGTNDDLTEPIAAGKETPDSTSGDAGSSDPGTSAESSSEPVEGPSPDDILDDVRRSLIEDEAVESEKQPRWWRRLGRGSTKQAPPAEERKAVEEIDLPEASIPSDNGELDQLKDELESEEYLDQIDELIDLLDDESDEPQIVTPAKVVEEVPTEPEKPVDLVELKKQAFQPRTSAEGTETLSEVRSIALEGEDEVFVEVEATPQDPLDERWKAFENSLKPYRRYIYFAIAFLGVVMAGIALTLIYNIYQQSQPAPQVAEVSNLPFPTAIALPGGWTFTLGKGTLTDGRWQPKGPEWLTGTEVCRWVSLPWSRQLELVVRSLNSDDSIELSMSNNDKLVYNVSSIREMGPEELQELDSNSPCLVIMLTQDGADTRWVLTALP